MRYLPHHGKDNVKGILSFLLIAFGTIFPAVAGPTEGRAGTQPVAVNESLRQKGLVVLRTGLEKEERWVKVHAAESLLSLDYPQGVAQIFERELAAKGSDPEYRIGIWRVLAQAARSNQEREQWISKIRAAFLDANGPDRLHAAETLAKLRYAPDELEVKMFELAAGNGPSALAANARWVLANRDAVRGETLLAEFLQSGDASARANSAYAIRHLPKISPTAWAKLAEAVFKEPTNSSARVYLVGAAFVHAPLDQKADFKAPLSGYASSGTKQERYEACSALARSGQDLDVPLLTGLFEDNDADVRISAAQAVLRIGRREPHRLAALDWVVVAAYGLLMLGVGWYWSRKTATTEHYLLGGRNMRPWMVGLSLFATLLSTISYLAVPGEMIQNGPMIFCGAAAYPLIFLVAGWFLIPVLMKSKATTAYEILESRLGPEVRTVGSIIFLTMRLLWMSLIIYATTYQVLVPLLNLPLASAPYICAALGLVTVAYTSMGGLPAVVLTDVIQTFILFSGAVLALLVVTISLGGWRAWWPAEWAPNWQAPEWGFNPTARISFIGILITSFTWWICTCGSDQLAVQRYLSTRDVRAARRSLLIALSTDLLINVFLGILGLALLAYFRVHPHFLGDGQTIAGNADQLFPRFMLLVLPQGIGGLVLVALLAAAMSSLSSGVNSACSVITVDFIQRFSKAEGSQASQIRLARQVSWSIGIATVLISFLIPGVKGNLLEIAYKVVNFLAAPLFGLFFMAIFVRWATVPGTIIGTIGGLGVGGAISYWEELTGNKGISFIWAIPLGLIAQVALGMIASLLPIGRRQPKPALRMEATSGGS